MAPLVLDAYWTGRRYRRGMTVSPDQTIALDNVATFASTNYPTMSEDDAFERFAGSLVLKKAGLDVTEIARGVVGKSNDGGIDGFYLLLNRSELAESDSIRLTGRKNAHDGLQRGVPLDVVIVQAKKETRWDTNVFPKIESALKAILDTTQSEGALRDFPLNDDLVEKAMMLRKLRQKLTTLVPTICFTVAYVAPAQQKTIDSYMKTKQKQLRQFLTDHLPSGSEVKVDYVGDVRIVELLRESADYTATIEFIKPPVREGKALVGLARIKDYVNFIRYPKSTTIREDMFALNVRDFAGTSVRVNEAIAKTLVADSASSFWWVNNGITIIADKAEDPHETTWVLTNPLIVNGLQTSHVIHSQSLAGVITRKRNAQGLLVRVITESDPDIREEVITGTMSRSCELKDS